MFLYILSCIFKGKKYKRQKRLILIIIDIGYKGDTVTFKVFLFQGAKPSAVDHFTFKFFPLLMSVRQ